MSHFSVLSTLPPDALLGLMAAFRADPRYHAVFNDPALKDVLEIRRENGRTEGLPVFPVKPYEGE